jgi:hypothetical protein
LRREKKASAEQDLRAMHEALKAAGRAWEEVEESVQDALADRDAADEALDVFAREVRLRLASRSLSATREAPYARIFAEGLDHWTAAPLDRVGERFVELGRRLELNLPEGDEVRARAGAELGGLVAAYKEAHEATRAAQADARRARLHYEERRSAWRGSMERLYGSLVAELGKAGARTFFPPSGSVRGEKDDGEA